MHRVRQKIGKGLARHHCPALLEGHLQIHQGVSQDRVAVGRLEGLVSRADARVSQQINNQPLHPDRAIHSKADKVLGTGVQPVLVALPEQLEITRNHPQGFLQVVGGDIGELLQIFVGTSQLEGTFGDPLLELVVECFELRLGAFPFDDPLLERFRHLIESMGQLLQLAAPLGHARPSFQVSLAETLRGAQQAPNAVENEDVPTVPCRHERQPADHGEAKEVADQHPVGRGVGHRQRNPDGHGNGGWIKSSPQRAEGIKAPHPISTRILNSPLARLRGGHIWTPGFAGRRQGHLLADITVFRIRVSHQSHPVSVEHGEGGSFREAGIGGQPAEPSQVEGRKHNGVGISLLVDHRVAQVQRRLLADPSHLIFPNREAPGPEGLPEIRAVREIHSLRDGDRTCQNLPVRLNRSKVQVALVKAQKFAKNRFTRLLLAAADFVELGQSDQ